MSDVDRLREQRKAGYWDSWYRKYPDRPVGMGLIGTYKRAVRYLDHDGCTLEDWGGGTGYARRFVQNATYRLVDGAVNPWVDEVTELTEYRSQVDCILMRHVLEHNVEWQRVLANVMASFTWRACIVLFIEPSEQSYDTAVDYPRARVPWWRFNLADLTDGNPCVNVEHVGRETLLYFDRRLTVESA